MLPYSFICNSVQVCVWLVRNSGHRMGLALGSWSSPMPSFWKELLEVAPVIKQDVLKYIKPVTFDSSSLWSGAICFSSWNKAKYLQTCCYYLKSDSSLNMKQREALSTIPSTFLSVGYKAFVHIMNSDILIADLYPSGHCCHNLYWLTVDYYVGLVLLIYFFSYLFPKR